MPAVAGVRDGIEFLGRSYSRRFGHRVRLERSCCLKMLGTPKNARVALEFEYSDDSRKEPADWWSAARVIGAPKRSSGPAAAAPSPPPPSAQHIWTFISAERHSSNERIGRERQKNELLVYFIKNTPKQERGEKGRTPKDYLEKFEQNS